MFQILYNSADGLPANFRETEIYQACVEAGLMPRSGEDAARLDTSADGIPLSPIETDIEEHLAQELTLQVEGMWCSACAWLVEAVLRKSRGVLAASVSFASDLAHLRYLPHRVRPEEMIASINRLGYRATPLTEVLDGATERNDLFMRLGVSAILTANIMMISFGLYGGLFAELGPSAIRTLSLPIALLSTVVLLYGGLPIFKRAVLGLRVGITSMDTLIAVGTLSAYLYSAAQLARNSIHLYFDTAAMLVTLVLLGKSIEAAARTRVSLGMRELYQVARQKVRLRVAGRDRWVAADAVQPGDEFVVEGGERVPVDGRILTGCARLDEALLTGEARPVTRAVDAEVMAGSLLIEGAVRLQATRVGPASTLGQMLSLLQQALQHQTPVELLADRITRWLVPGVLLLAAVTAGVLRGTGVPWEDAVLRAITVLVITCPCALGLATPLARVAAVGVGRRQGIVVRNAEALEKLSTIDVIIFDKTGTLTDGTFTLRRVVSTAVSEDELLRRAACIELHADHFLARETVRKASEAGLEMEPAIEFESMEGLGVRAVLGGVGEVVVGNRQCLQEQGLTLPSELDQNAAHWEEQGATVVFCGWAGWAHGLLVFADALRPASKATLDALRRRNLAIQLVSGDSQQTVQAVAASLGVNQWVGQTLPQDKVAIVRDWQQEGRRVAMVGDGINDAAALAQADVGVALGVRASITHEASDLTLLSDDPGRLLEALRLASRTMRTIRQNLFFAFFYNLLGIPLAIAGLLNPLIAVCAMLASSLTVIANTLLLSRGDARPRV